jgi:hypothetical protein
MTEVVEQEPKPEMTQFMFELEEDLYRRLKRESFRRSMEDNVRVSMSQLVREALETALPSDGGP